MIETASKSEFAALCKVSPGRVSQWLSAGTISGAAIIGVGRNARIAVGEARRQLASRLDPARATADRRESLLPRGFEALAGIDDPFLAGAAWMALAMTYRAGADAAGAAVQCGAPASIAKKIRDLATVVACRRVEDALPNLGITFDPDCFDDIDIGALEATSG